MTSLIKATWELIMRLFGQSPTKRETRKARKEVKREKESGGMDAVRDNSSKWFERNRR